VGAGVVRGGLAGGDVGVPAIAGVGPPAITRCSESARA